MLPQDQYLEISTQLSSSAYVYGAGQRASGTARMTVSRPIVQAWTAIACACSNLFERRQ